MKAQTAAEPHRSNPGNCAAYPEAARDYRFTSPPFGEAPFSQIPHLRTKEKGIGNLLPSTPFRSKLGYQYINPLW